MTDRVVSKIAAHRIWTAHHEIEAAEKLLKNIRDELDRGEEPTPRDAFGRVRRYSLGVPMASSGGEHLLDVSPKLASYIIEAHIAAKRKELLEASIAARLEMDDGVDHGRTP